MTKQAVVEYAGANLYPKQRAAIFDDARISCIEAGTKCGKTIGCLAWLLEEALRLGKDGRNFWWVAPVYGQAEIGYRRMKARLPAHLYKPNQSTLTLTLATGARIQFRSGERSDDLYGEDVYACVIDEASRMREESWYALRSTLTSTQGKVRIIGNVRGRKNWFFELCRLAESGEPDMAYHKITCYDAVDAGVLNKQEIDDAKRHFEILGQESMFRQLYLAEAVAEDDNPFGLEAIKRCVVPEMSRDLPTVAGVDLAGRGAVNVNQTGDPLARDWTAIVMLDREGTTTYMDRFRMPHTETAEKIAKTVRRTPALIDATGAGDPVVELLQRRGDMRVEGYLYTPRSRQDLLEGLALAIGEERIHFPDGRLRQELETFEYRYSKMGVRFACPDRMNDDMVMALALAVRKMPWRRKHFMSPTGIENPSGSRWSAQGGGNDAWQRYKESQKPTLSDVDEADIPSRAKPPILITGPTSSRWTSNM